MSPGAGRPVIAWRDAARGRLSSGTFDLVVIGGGITGAGVARDAALRGLSVALVERDDFASGTSSRSSRLIHGGVRYLEHGHFHLVFEASHERRTLLQTAPRLVRPLRFTWPVYAGARIPRWKLSAGLGLYDALALFSNVGRHRRRSASGICEAEPALRSDDLLGGAQYWDAATDDSVLTLATVLSAAAHGAVVLNHARVIALTGGESPELVIRDSLGAGDFTVRARTVVNATGPWTDDIRRLEAAESPAAVLGTKGVHIAVPAARVGNRGAITMLSPRDARVMFCLPAGEQTIIGTTDTATTMPPDDVRATRDDVAYLLEAVNAYFPGAALTARDVLASWAGIRPLVAARNAGDPASASREHAIATGPRGIITVTGGKLTTYRRIAEQVVDVVVRKLRAQPTAHSCRTALEPLELPPRSPVFGQLFEPILPGHAWTLADAVHGAEREMACTLGDILIRRTKVAFASRDHGIPAALRVAQAVARHLDWDAAECARQVESYCAECARMFTVEA